MVGYIEASVIVEGAYDGEIAFSGPDQGERFTDWFNREMQEAAPNTDIYVMYHGHDEDVEDCVCGQYLTDHHPYWSNREA